MRLIRGRDGAQSIQQGANFTGDVRADPILLGEDEVTVHEVFFAPRSRTFWHNHHGGQILIVRAGSGVVASRSGLVIPVRAGDTVWTPPGEDHWHGACEDSFLVHTAISLGGHTWLEEVDKDVYERALARISLPLQRRSRDLPRP